MMRIFVAIDIDQHVKDELADLIGELKDSIVARSGEMKWVRSGSIHLTLKFIGEVADNDVMKVCQAVEKVAGNYNHFHIELGEVGTFGNPPKVIRVGVKDEDGTLTKMANELEDELFELGFDREGRKFAPHLTLCRIKSLKAGRNTEDVISEFEDYEGPDLPVEAVCVYQSTLTEKGSEYTVISKVELK